MFIFSGYLLVTILIFALSLAIHRCSDYAKRLKLVADRVLFEPSQFYSLSFKLALAFLFFEVFVFLNQNFLGGGIKTDKVVIDTSEIINSLPKLMETKKTMIAFYDEDAQLSSAPEHSFWWKLAKKPRFLIAQTMSVKEKNAFVAQQIDSYFVLAIDVDLYFEMSVLAGYLKKGEWVAFIRSQIYRESFLQVFYLRRSLDADKKRFLHNRLRFSSALKFSIGTFDLKSNNNQFCPFYSIERSFEGGLVLNWVEKTNEKMSSQVENKMKLYRSLQEYTDDLSYDSEVKLENLSRAFYVFFLVLGWISMVFAAVWCLFGSRMIIVIVQMQVSLTKNLWRSRQASQD